MTQLTWRKAESCHANGTCVEIAAARHPLTGWAHILVRDAKDPDSGQLAFLHADWARFVTAVKGR